MGKIFRRRKSDPTLVAYISAYMELRSAVRVFGYNMQEHLKNSTDNFSIQRVKGLTDKNDEITKKLAGEMP